MNANAATLLSALRSVCPVGTCHPREVRAVAGLSKVDFDAAANDLRKTEIVCLYHHDAAAWLPAAERESLVSLGEYHFNMMSIRRGR